MCYGDWGGGCAAVPGGDEGADDGRQRTVICDRWSAGGKLIPLLTDSALKLRCAKSLGNVAEGFRQGHFLDSAVSGRGGMTTSKVCKSGLWD